MPPKVLVVTGPTATGKSELGVRLAIELDGEVVSADSMQIYMGMDIGTAKPTADEMRGIRHHMINVADVTETYSVARYVDEAALCVDDILARGKLPVIVGGTGLYIDSLISGRTFAAEAADGATRERLNREFDEKGGERMLDRLAEADPASAARLHPADRKRIIRALEVFEETGKTITHHNLETRALPKRYDALEIVLSFSARERLYSRINRRVDKMRALGLTEEVKRLLNNGARVDSTAMQAIGYKELALAISGEITEEEAYDKIKMESRRYAKRQLTWLRKHENANWILWDEAPDYDYGVDTVLKLWGDWN